MLLYPIYSIWERLFTNHLGVPSDATNCSEIKLFILEKISTEELRINVKLQIIPEILSSFMSLWEYVVPCRCWRRSTSWRAGTRTACDSRPSTCGTGCWCPSKSCVASRTRQWTTVSSSLNISWGHWRTSTSPPQSPSNGLSANVIYFLGKVEAAVVTCHGRYETNCL